MPFIDAHHHLWCPEDTAHDVGYVWLRDIGKTKPFGDPTPIQRNYLASEFLAESPERPLASVHLQCDPALVDPVRETEWVAQQARSQGHVIGIVGYVDLTREDAATMLQRHMAFPEFRGIRQIIARTDARPDISFVKAKLLDHPRIREHFALLGEHGLSFDLQLYPEQMKAAAAFLADFPHIPIIIDHWGSPYDQSPAGFTMWREGLQVLSELPQVTMKLSGFGMYDRFWTAESLKPYFDVVFSSFGAERVMFGSNFPVDKLMTSYDHCLSQTQLLIADLPPEDQQAILMENSRRIYRL